MPEQPNNFQQHKNLGSPDFSKISERPANAKWKKYLFLSLKILAGLIIAVIIFLGILGAVYYHNLTQSYSLILSAKTDMEQSLHLAVNRNFSGSAESLQTANAKLVQAKVLLSKIVIVRSLPYLGVQLTSVDKVLDAGIKLSSDGQQVMLLIDDITAPLHNESITYTSITAAQKRQILQKIVDSQALLLEVQTDIDQADQSISEIPTDCLVKPLRNGILPLQQYLPKAKMLIDNALPLLSTIPKVAGFDDAKSYLFLLQNNSELRPTGGFIGTYGILKLKDGEIAEFNSDNVYNLDRSTQPILKIPSPWPIAKYLEQNNWSLRDSNWAPDFPTTANQAIDIYNKENQEIIALTQSGQKIIGEKGTIIPEVIPYEKNIYGVIGITSNVLGGLLKLTGPVVASDMVFTSDNYQDQLELLIGKLYQQLNIPIAQRKGVIKQLADQIIAKLSTLPLSQMPDVLQVGFDALSQKQIQIYMTDPDIEKIVVDRGWGGDIKQVDGDYLMVVDSNLASLKTDQYVKRSINYSLSQQGSDLIGQVDIKYQNNADFTWKSTRLRSYTRVYVPLGSELISSSGAMENDITKNPQKQPGQVESSSEFGKTYFGAFISIEPHEQGTLSFKYKLPSKIKDQLNNNNYQLLVQKQAGVLPSLTLDLKFGKNIKSAAPPEPQSEWFNTSYNNSFVLDKDTQFNVKF